MTDDDLDLDVEETVETIDSSGPDPVRLQKEIEKLRKENHSLRVRTRRTEMAAEYGADVLELIDDDLPLDKQKSLAEKLAARLRSNEPSPTETEEPEPPKVEVPQGLKAVAGSSAPGTDTARPELSVIDIEKLGKSDPQAALAAIRAQYRT